MKIFIKNRKAHAKFLVDWPNGLGVPKEHIDKQTNKHKPLIIIEEQFISTLYNSYMAGVNRSYLILIEVRKIETKTEPKL